MVKLNPTLLLLVYTLLTQCQMQDRSPEHTESQVARPIKSITTNEYELGLASKVEEWQLKRRSLDLFDSLGRNTQTNEYSRNHELIEIIKHEYVSGRKVMSQTKKGVARSLDSFFYDDRGLNTRELRYSYSLFDEKYELLHTTLRKYNSNRQCVLSQLISDSDKHTWKYAYDANGNETQQFFQDDDGQFKRVYSQEFDDFGNVVKRTIYEDGLLYRVVTYEYKYNKEGDWIQRRTFFNDVLTYRTTREIKYRK